MFAQRTVVDSSQICSIRSGAHDPPAEEDEPARCTVAGWCFLENTPTRSQRCASFLTCRPTATVGCLLFLRILSIERMSARKYAGVSPLVTERAKQSKATAILMCKRQHFAWRDVSRSAVQTRSSTLHTADRLFTPRKGALSDSWLHRPARPLQVV
jgi:hypothetical protein